MSLDLVVEVIVGPQGPRGQPGLGLPLGSLDEGPGAQVIAIAANVPTWNRSSNAAQNTYEIPADAVPWPHAITWRAGLAPIVNPPEGWSIWNPAKSEMGSTYEYVQGPGESYTWFASPMEQEVWPL
jgi:hypothetical protein